MKLDGVTITLVVVENVIPDVVLWTIWLQGMICVSIVLCGQVYR
jgi:hypothetical protein